MKLWPFVFRSSYEAVLDEIDCLHEEIDSLKAALAQSRKNDTPKDPITGKFTKG